MGEDRRRAVLTLEWRGRGGATVSVGDDYVEAGCAPPPALTRREHEVLQVASPAAVAFAERMENWRRTVRFSTGGGGCCAAWAALYIKSRARDGDGGEPAPPRQIVTVDQLDGWLVEAAVRSLAVYEEKMALRYWYVHRYPEHWIKTRLMMRARAVRLVLWRAEKNLQKVLDKLENPATILHNNLHAGDDPRPVNDARGVSLTLEKAQALVE